MSEYRTYHDPLHVSAQAAGAFARDEEWRVLETELHENSTT